MRFGGVSDSNCERCFGQPSGIPLGDTDVRRQAFEQQVHSMSQILSVTQFENESLIHLHADSARASRCAEARKPTEPILNSVGHLLILIGS
jgi:hypothetical protein